MILTGYGWISSALFSNPILCRTKPYPFSHIKIGMIFYFTELHERSEVSEVMFIDTGRL